MTAREIVFLVFSILGGACIGSFTNVIIHRLPRPLDEPSEWGDLWDTNPWRSVLGGESVCASCGRELTATDLVPVLSWLALRGKCRSCGARIAAYHPLVELAVPALGVLSWAVVGWGWRLPLALWLIPVGIAIAVIDLQTFIVPTRLVWPATGVAVVIGAIVALTTGNPGWLLNGLIGVLALAGPLAIIWFALPSGMGFGDVRLTCFAGWIVGFNSGETLGGAAVLSLVVLGSAAILGLVIGVVALGARGRKAKVPFGPSLLIAGLGCAIWAPEILDGLIGTT